MKTIFVVDDNNVSLLSADEALSAFYRVFTMPSAFSMLELLQDVKPDLILLDILMPDMDGFEALKLMRSSSSYADIPVIFLTSRNDTLTETLGFELGAIDFISKPFSKPVLLNRIKTYLEIEEIVRERTNRLIKMKNTIVSVLANMVENRDIMIGSHIERVTRYIRLLLDSMVEHKVYYNEISKWDLESVIAASCLHDIGKIVITDLMLSKPGSLTKDEYETIKTHVIEGEKIIDCIVTESGDEFFLQNAKLFASYHHERWDGLGYPYGLKGTEIPLQGRLMAIADVYDALVTERPYKQVLTHEEAEKVVIGNSGTHFDPKLVDVFRDVSESFKNVILQR